MTTPAHTRAVAEVLAAHWYGYTTDECGWEWAACQGCSWPNDERIGRGPGYDAHREHQADMLAAAGLLADPAHDAQVAAKAWDEGFERAHSQHYAEDLRLGRRTPAINADNPHRIERQEAPDDPR